MADPQKEDGYTDIANETMETLAKFRLSGNEWQVLCAILRKTYGWHKKTDQISLTQLAEMTGLSRCHVVHAVAKLCNRGVAEKGNTYIRTYGFQKDYSKWKVLPKTATGCRNVQQGVAENGNKTVAENGTYKTKETNYTKPIEITQPQKTTSSKPSLNYETPPLDALSPFPPRITAAPPPSPLKEYAQIFRQIYKETTGQNYSVNWGRDLKQLKTGGVAEIPRKEFENLCRRFFDPDHAYKGNCDIPSFVKAINRLKMIGLPKEQPKPRSLGARPAGE